YHGSTLRSCGRSRSMILSRSRSSSNVSFEMQAKNHRTFKRNGGGAFAPPPLKSPKPTSPFVSGRFRHGEEERPGVHLLLGLFGRETVALLHPVHQCVAGAVDGIDVALCQMEPVPPRTGRQFRPVAFNLVPSHD